MGVRVEVAQRQVKNRPDLAVYWDLYRSRMLEIVGQPWPLRDRLGSMLWQLFGEQVAHLDHDPALILRYFNPVTGNYTPAANDPNHLIYRTERDHLEKTTGRKSDAERTVTTKGSDIYLKAKFRRLESKPRRKAKIPSRPFSSKTRKFSVK